MCAANASDNQGRRALDDGLLNAQQAHWNNVFATHPDMYSREPSHAAQYALPLFQAAGGQVLLELGAGQGRDTLFFAQAGFQVCAAEYAWVGLDAIARHAQAEGLTDRITPLAHDVRYPLPFPDGWFDACYSHMLYNMALTDAELAGLSAEIRRVLRPGGLNVFTARNEHDAHYGRGICRGEDLYEESGYIVHFFTRQTVDRVAEGYTVEAISEFEEGTLPRRLYLVTLRRP